MHRVNTLVTGIKGLGFSAMVSIVEQKAHALTVNDVNGLLDHSLPILTAIAQILIATITIIKLLKNNKKDNE
jgi:hypothetical protein